MQVKTLINIKDDDYSYRNYHVKHDKSKAFVTSTEGFWDQTEYPILRVEKREISSKNIFHLSNLEERQIEVACIVYSHDINEAVVEKTMAAKDVIEALLKFDKDAYICCYPDTTEEGHIYIDCINVIPSDNYDCRCKNIETLYKEHHKTAFLA